MKKVSKRFPTLHAATCTHIQGSVEESPSDERKRSLDRPGAKTPLPYPRMEMHHGSFIVNLTNGHYGSSSGAVSSGQNAGHAPVFDTVAEALEADLFIH